MAGTAAAAAARAVQERPSLARATQPEPKRERARSAKRRDLRNSTRVRRRYRHAEVDPNCANCGTGRWSRAGRPSSNSVNTLAHKVHARRAIKTLAIDSLSSDSQGGSKKLAAKYGYNNLSSGPFARHNAKPLSKSGLLMNVANSRCGQASHSSDSGRLPARQIAAHCCRKSLATARQLSQFRPEIDPAASCKWSGRRKRLAAGAYSELGNQFRVARLVGFGCGGGGQLRRRALRIGAKFGSLVSYWRRVAGQLAGRTNELPPQLASNSCKRRLCERVDCRRRPTGVGGNWQRGGGGAWKELGATCAPPASGAPRRRGGGGG